MAVNPGISKARTYIESLIDTAAANQPSRLPPASRLALKAGVSVSTMLKAIFLSYVAYS